METLVIPILINNIPLDKFMELNIIENYLLYEQPPGRDIEIATYKIYTINPKVYFRNGIIKLLCLINNYRILKQIRRLFPRR